MPFAKVDGINVHYEALGSGPPLLMLAPGGFDASISRWRMNGVWEELQPLDTLAKSFQIIAYDRREIGESSARVEPLSWNVYAREAIGLLDHLKIERAYFLGGCIGCALGLAIGALAPSRCRALLLHWPVGGYRWMLKGKEAFDGHIDFVRNEGLQAAVERARKNKTFWRGDPAGGPWAWSISADPTFADTFLKLNVETYIKVVQQSRDNMFFDTMPSGASGEQLIKMNVPTFIMSGDDPSHAHSAAVTLRELMPNVKLSPVMPQQQNAATVGQWIKDSINAAA